MTVRAAAPIRRKLCQVKACQGDAAKRVCKSCWRCCLEGAKGPPAAVPAVGSEERRVHQAVAQGPVGLVIHPAWDFSARKET